MSKDGSDFSSLLEEDTCPRIDLWRRIHVAFAPKDGSDSSSLLLRTKSGDLDILSRVIFSTFRSQGWIGLFQSSGCSAEERCVCGGGYERACAMIAQFEGG